MCPPPEIKQAKRIKIALGQKADLGDATETFGLETGFEDSTILRQTDEESEDDDDDIDSEDEGGEGSVEVAILLEDGADLVADMAVVVAKNKMGGGGRWSTNVRR